MRICGVLYLHIKSASRTSPLVLDISTTASHFHKRCECINPLLACGPFLKLLLLFRANPHLTLGVRQATFT